MTVARFFQFGNRLLHGKTVKNDPAGSNRSSGSITAVPTVYQ